MKKLTFLSLIAALVYLMITATQPARAESAVIAATTSAEPTITAKEDEPPAYFMLLAGLGAVAFITLRRQR